MSTNTSQRQSNKSAAATQNNAEEQQQQWQARAAELSLLRFSAASISAHSKKGDASSILSASLSVPSIDAKTISQSIQSVDAVAVAAADDDDANIGRTEAAHTAAPTRASPSTVGRSSSDRAAAADTSSLSNKAARRRREADEEQRRAQVVSLQKMARHDNRKDGTDKNVAQDVQGDHHLTSWLAQRIMQEWRQSVEEGRKTYMDSPYSSAGAKWFGQCVHDITVGPHSSEFQCVELALKRLGREASLVDCDADEPSVETFTEAIVDFLATSGNLKPSKCFSDVMKLLDQLVRFERDILVKVVRRRVRMASRESGKGEVDISGAKHNIVFMFNLCGWKGGLPLVLDACADDLTPVLRILTVALDLVAAGMAHLNDFGEKEVDGAVVKTAAGQKGSAERLDCGLECGFFSVAAGQTALLECLMGLCGRGKASLVKYFVCFLADGDLPASATASRESCVLEQLIRSICTLARRCFNMKAVTAKCCVSLVRLSVLEMEAKREPDQKGLVCQWLEFLAPQQKVASPIDQRHERKTGWVMTWVDDAVPFTNERLRLSLAEALLSVVKVENLAAVDGSMLRLVDRIRSSCNHVVPRHRAQALYVLKSWLAAMRRLLRLPLSSPAYETAEACMPLYVGHIMSLVESNFEHSYQLMAAICKDIVKLALECHTLSCKLFASSKLSAVHTLDVEKRERRVPSRFSPALEGLIASLLRDLSSSRVSRGTLVTLDCLIPYVGGRGILAVEPSFVRVLFRVGAGGKLRGLARRAFTTFVLQCGVETGFLVSDNNCGADMQAATGDKKRKKKKRRKVKASKVQGHNVGSAEVGPQGEQEASRTRPDALDAFRKSWLMPVVDFIIDTVRAQMEPTSLGVALQFLFSYDGACVGTILDALALRCKGVVAQWPRRTAAERWPMERVATDGAILVLQHARCAGAISIVELEKYIVSGSGPLKNALRLARCDLLQALVSSEVRSRTAALSLVCITADKSSAPTGFELQLLRDALPFLLKEDIIPWAQVLIQALKDVIGRILKNSDVEGMSFCSWLERLLISGLVPGSPNDLTGTCLSLLKYFMQLKRPFNFKKNNSGLGAADADSSHRALSGNRQDSNGEQLKGLVRALIHQMQSSYEQTRILAASCLSLLPPRLPGYENEASVWRLCTTALRLSNSLKLYEADAGVRLLLMIFRKYVVSCNWYVPMSSLYVRVVKSSMAASPSLSSEYGHGKLWKRMADERKRRQMQHSASAASMTPVHFFLEEILSVLEIHGATVGDWPVSKRFSFAPAWIHGVLGCFRMIASVLDWREHSLYLDKVQFVDRLLRALLTVLGGRPEAGNLNVHKRCVGVRAALKVPLGQTVTSSVARWLCVREISLILGEWVAHGPVTPGVGYVHHDEQDCSNENEGPPALKKAGTCVVVPPLFSIEHLKLIGQFLLTILGSTDHQGAIERTHAGLMLVSERLLTSGSPQLFSLVATWLNELFSLLQDISSRDVDDAWANSKKGQGFLRTTAVGEYGHANDGGSDSSVMKPKRTVVTSSTADIANQRNRQGLPYSFRALLVGHGMGSSSQLLQQTVRELLVLARGKRSTDQEDVAHPWRFQVHAMSVLGALFRDAAMTVELFPFVADAVVVAVEGFAHPVWNVRSASLVLFGTVLRRTVIRSADERAIRAPSEGASDEQRAVGSEDDGADFHCNESAYSRKTGARSLSVDEFFAQYPSLRDFLVLTLEACTAPAASLSSAAVHPQLYPILAMLSRMSRGTSRGNDIDEDDTKGACGDAFLPFLKRCSRHPNHMVRATSAEAGAIVVPPKSVVPFLDHLFAALAEPSSDTPVYHNAVHGALLQIREMVVLNGGSIFRDIGLTLKVVQALWDVRWLISSRMQCMTIQREYLRVLSALEDVHRRTAALQSDNAFAKVVWPRIGDCTANCHFACSCYDAGRLSKGNSGSIPCGAAHAYPGLSWLCLCCLDVLLSHGSGNDIHVKLPSSRDSHLIGHDPLLMFVAKQACVAFLRVPDLSKSLVIHYSGFTYKAAQAAAFVWLEMLLANSRLGVRHIALRALMRAPAGIGQACASVLGMSKLEAILLIGDLLWKQLVEFISSGGKHSHSSDMFEWVLAILDMLAVLCSSEESFLPGQQWLTAVGHLSSCWSWSQHSGVRASTLKLFVNTAVYAPTALLGVAATSSEVHEAHDGVIDSWLSRWRSAASPEADIVLRSAAAEGLYVWASRSIAQRDVSALRFRYNDVCQIIVTLLQDDVASIRQQASDCVVALVGKHSALVFKVTDFLSPQVGELKDSVWCPFSNRGGALVPSLALPTLFHHLVVSATSESEQWLLIQWMYNEILCPKSSMKNFRKALKKGTSCDSPEALFEEMESNDYVEPWELIRCVAGYLPMLLAKWGKGKGEGGGNWYEQGVTPIEWVRTQQRGALRHLLGVWSLLQTASTTKPHGVVQTLESPGAFIAFMATVLNVSVWLSPQVRSIERDQNGPSIAFVSDTILLRTVARMVGLGNVAVTDQSAGVFGPVSRAHPSLDLLLMQLRTYIEEVVATHTTQ